jgi:uncharacterized membrane protein YhaH (DUF805 family)
MALLLTISFWLLILVIPVWLFLWYIDIVATIKRLHDLGRPGDDIIKTFLPILGSIMDLKLWYESGQNEIDHETFKEYQIREYEKKKRAKNPRDDIEYKL